MPGLEAPKIPETLAPGDRVRIRLEGANFATADVESNDSDLGGRRRLVTNQGTVRESPDGLWMWWRGGEMRTSDVSGLEVCS